MNFGVGKGGPLGELGLVIEPNAHPIGHPTATPHALIGLGLGNGFDLQLLHFGTIPIAFYSGQTAVHHVADIRHGQ